MTDGPVAQSIGIGFRVLRVGLAVLVLAWLTLNVRPVPPESQAVILRFGRIVRVQQAGLVLAWPRPIDRVVLLPSGARQMKTTIVAGTGNAADMLDEVSLALGETVPATAGVFLTGDGGVVLFDASLTWRISDAAAYYLAADHVAPALRRLFVASAVGIAASRNIDDMIAVRPEHAEGDAAAQAQRETLRADLAAAMNRRLAALAADGAGLGVEIARVDLATLLLPQAKEAFDNVLNAAQTAEQGLANARTDAARTRQGAERDANRTLAEAHALAAEHIAEATGKTAEIVALAQNTLPEARASMLDQVYRERIGKVLRQAGATSAVDTRGVGRLILP